MSFVAAYGLLWALVEPPIALVAGSQFQGWEKYLAFVVGAVLLGLWHLYPYREIRLNLPHTDTSIEVVFGDLFEASGQKVIAVNDCFDSLLGQVVAPTSLHGKFISRKLNGVSVEFDRLVSGELKKISGQPIARRDGGKTTRYLVGTTVHAQWKGEDFYFVALAVTDPVSSVANATLPEFWTALEGLWISVRTFSNDEEVVVPLLGSGLSRVGLPPSQLLYFLLSSFVAETKRQKITRRLKVVLHDSVFDQVDLCEFKRNWLK